MTLTEFLAARLDEDDRLAREIGHRSAWEAKARREIYALHKPTPMICPICVKPGSRGKMMALAPCPTLRALGWIWSDHPDYDPAWAPES